MRRWFVPLTVLGLGGLGAFLLSERGKVTLARMLQAITETPDRLLEWNGTTETEIDRIQDALNRIAESLQPRPQLGH